MRGTLADWPTGFVLEGHVRARQVTHDSVLGAVRNQDGSKGVRMKNCIENLDKEILDKLIRATRSEANLPIWSGIGFLV